MIDQKDEEDVFMNLWMKGTEGREIFSLKSPPNKAFKKHNLPYDVSNAPYLTLTARQYGEAWEHPFVSVYEPFTSTEGKSIKSIQSFEDEKNNKEFVGLHITSKSEREDFIFSSKNQYKANYKGMVSDASYALVGEEKNGDVILFMGKGNILKAKGYTISTSTLGNVVLEVKNGQVFLHNEVPVVITQNNIEKKFSAGDFRVINLK
ncbi:hypothetical protein OEG92_07320 [Polaribacter sejongensis]|uniref:hypothetical protein n=1 Tax=Polaribacter sejongensis TaxID=985043 RepID=UPI0035A58C6A